MALYRLVLGLALGLVALAGVAGELVGRVVSVHDGDTLTVLVDSRQIKVRLAEIDAPELGQPFGKRSREDLADLCADKPAQVDDRGKDRYGRTIGCGRERRAGAHRHGLGVYDRYAAKDSPLYVLQAWARGQRRGSGGRSALSYRADVAAALLDLLR